MNQLLLVGRLTRPVEDRQVGDHRVVNNCLAVSRRHRDRNGELQTDFIPIVAWDYLADLLVKYAQKGHRIGVVGRMESRHYTNNQDQKVYILECHVQDITLLESKNGSAGRASGQNHSTPKGQEDYDTIRRQYEVPSQEQLDMRQLAGFKA